MTRALVALGLTLAVANPASAYVRTRSSVGKGTPSYWPGTCVFVQPNAPGTPDMANADTFRIVQKSMQNWLDADGNCSYLQLMYDQPAARDAHYDGFNVVAFRTDQWCHPNDAQNKDVCYDKSAAAITSVFMINDGGPQDGLILDADIELNNINFKFVELGTGVAPTPDPPRALADLENTLTHELGHLQGLSHTCKDAASFPNDVDENGNPPPECSVVATWPPGPDKSKIVDATMYNYAQPGETKKRSPEADDLAGICNAYPKDKDPKSCEHTDLVKLTHRGGCDFGPQVAAGGPVGVPLVALALFALLVGARRRFS